MPLLQQLASVVSGALGRDSRVIRALRPAYERLLDLVTSGRGFLRVVNGRERFYIHPKARGLFPEVYEPAVCAYLRERVGRGALALNVGAHVGVYTLCLAEWSGPQGRVIAFEPNPASRGVLQDHVRRNGLGERVVVEPLAIGRAVGRMTFHAAGLEGTSRLGQPSPEREVRHRRVEVDVTTIDAYCGGRRLAPDWIVMDVEGYEVAALEGARETIAARGRALGLVVEMHPHLWELSGASRLQAERLVRDLGLRVRGLTGQDDPLGSPGVVALEPIGGRVA
jgi:FkbM family methyltransferase